MISCEICGEKLEMISYSHLKRHHISAKDYREKFPHAQLVSDETRAKMSMIRLGHIYSLETRQKISRAKKGHIKSPETCRKLSESHLGLTPWNKGLTVKDQRVRKNIERRRETILRKYGTLYLGGRPKKGTIPWNRGLTKNTNSKIEESAKKIKEHWRNNKRIPWNKNLTKQVDERVKAYGMKIREKKLSQNLKGKIGKWNRGRKASEEARRKMSQARKNKRFSAEHKKNLSCALKEICSQPAHRQKLSEIRKVLWMNPSYREKIVKSVLKSVCAKPNKQEALLSRVLQKVVPNEYLYVGDGSLVIAGKCPDFMNVNGKKRLIELYGDYWHRGENPQERIAYFKQFGFETLVIWEHELKDMDYLAEKIITFNGEN